MEKAVIIFVVINSAYTLFAFFRDRSHLKHYEQVRDWRFYEKTAMQKEIQALRKINHGLINERHQGKQND